VPRIKLYGNPSNESRDDTCGRTDMMKLTDTFRDNANAPNKIGHHDYDACHITAKSPSQNRKILPVSRSA